MKKRIRFKDCLIFFIVIPFFLQSQEKIHTDILEKIREEGFERSKVNDYIWKISDYFGPRLPASKNIRKTQEWALDLVKNMGLENARLEGIGRKYASWNLKKVSVHMIEPDYQMVIAYPLANTPSTEGLVVSNAIIVSILDSSDIEKYRGKLANKIILLDPERKVDYIDMLDVIRHDEESLKGLEAGKDLNMAKRRKSNAFYGRMPRPKGISRTELESFLKNENVAVILEAGRGRDGSVNVGRRLTRRTDRSIEGIKKGIPTLSVASEHYNRIYRLLSKNIDVKMEIEINIDIPEQEIEGRNLIAELQGTDLKDEIVMIGAHLDSWHAGTGATDNACGVAVVLEVMRIFKALDLKPRRTIRMALWTDEETGLHGSKAYVDKEFGVKGEKKSSYDKLSIYLNSDSGSGQYRGIHIIKNQEAVPIFNAWMKPFHDLKVTTISNYNLTGSDHKQFNEIGLPGFHFIQDRLDYRNRTWHYNMDTYDHVQIEDLKINAVVLASFSYHAAMRDNMFPRVIQETNKTD
jgi:carboxypeptidase Q